MTSPCNFTTVSSVYYAIILLMVLLSVANSINMALFERIRELGTLLALGDRPATVFRLIMTESALLGLIGAGLGMTLECVFRDWHSDAPPPNADIGYTAFIRLVPLDVLTTRGIGFVATFLASCRPDGHHECK